MTHEDALAMIDTLRLISLTLSILTGGLFGTVLAKTGAMYIEYRRIKRGDDQ
jgi:hypothetical protein